jgi:hypothetical protein
MRGRQAILTRLSFLGFPQPSHMDVFMDATAASYRSPSNSSFTDVHTLNMLEVSLNKSRRIRRETPPPLPRRHSCGVTRLLAAVSTGWQQFARERCELRKWGKFHKVAHPIAS